MKADDIAPLLATSGALAEVGFHQGQVLAWDAATNTNRIAVAGTEVVDLPVLAAGSVLINAGDHVGVLRIRHQYFILGRIAPIQQAMSMRGTYTSALASTTSTSYTDLAGSAGPTLTDVYIGPSRRCLVLMKASMSVPTVASSFSQAAMSVAVSGASTITADWMNPAAAYVSTAGASVSLSASSHTIISANDGLNEGLNTFTCKYKSTNSHSVQFLDRDLFVLPM